MILRLSCKSIVELSRGGTVQRQRREIGKRGTCPRGWRCRRPAPRATSRAGPERPDLGRSAAEGSRVSCPPLRAMAVVAKSRQTRASSRTNRRRLATRGVAAPTQRPSAATERRWSTRRGLALQHAAEARPVVVRQVGAKLYVPPVAMQHAVHLLAVSEQPLRVADNVAVVQVGPHPGWPVRRPRPGWPSARLGEHVSNGAQIRCQHLEFRLVDFVQLVRGHHRFRVFRLRTTGCRLARAPGVLRGASALGAGAPSESASRSPSCAGPSYKRPASSSMAFGSRPARAAGGAPRAARPAGADRTRQWRSSSTPSCAFAAWRSFKAS